MGFFREFLISSTLVYPEKHIQIDNFPRKSLFFDQFWCFWTSPKLLPPRWIGKLPNPNGPQWQTALFIQKFTVSERNKSYKKFEKKNYHNCWVFWIHQLSRKPCQPCLWWTLLRKLPCFKGGFQKNTAAPQDPWKTNKVPHRPGQFHGLKVASKDRISTSNVTGITLLGFLDANSICLQHWKLTWQSKNNSLKMYISY